MTTIHFLLRDGSTRTVAADHGQSLMEVAIQNNIRGIDAECGGCCACATCHVYVTDECLAMPAPPDEMERETLEGVSAERRAGSRLSCQITLGPALDGLTVRIPPEHG